MSYLDVQLAVFAATLVHTRRSITRYIPLYDGLQANKKTGGGRMSSTVKIYSLLLGITIFGINLIGCVQNQENNLPKKIVTDKQSNETYSTDSSGEHFEAEGDTQINAGSRGSWSVHTTSTDNGYGWQDDITNQDGQHFHSEEHPEDNAH
jgi:hypothetical protein